MSYKLQETPAHMCLINVWCATAFCRFDSLFCIKYYNYLILIVSFCSTYSHLRQFGLMTEDPKLWWKAGLGVAAATMLGFIVLKTISAAGAHSR